MTESKIVLGVVGTAASTESILGTSDTVHYQQPLGEGLCVRGLINFTAGTTTTAVVIRCHKGANTITGVGLNPGAGLTHTLAAGATASLFYEFVDPNPVIDPLATPAGAAPAPANVYTVSIQQTGGTAGGTQNYGTIGIVPVSAGW